MKKLLLLLLAFSLILCGCNAKLKNSKEESTSEDGKTGEKIDINTYIRNLDNPENYIMIGNYKGVQVKELTVTEDDIEALRADVLNRYAYHAPIKDKTVVEKGDCVNISYVSYLNGEAFEGGTGNDDIVVGEGKFIFPEVEDKLVNLNVGNSLSIAVKVPEDYFSNGLRGKTIQLHITVEQIQEEKTTAPEIDDAFVKEHFGLDSAEEFDDYALDFLTKEAEDKMMTSAWQAVLANCEMISFPDDIDELYVDDMYEHYKEQAAKYDAGPEIFIGTNTDAWRVEALKYAQSYYKSELAMYSIYDREFASRNLTKEEYKERVEGYAKDANLTVAELEKKFTKEELTTSFHWDKVMELVWENRATE